MRAGMLSAREHSVPDTVHSFRAAANGVEFGFVDDVFDDDVTIQRIVEGSRHEAVD
jgi:hypothetical protein